MLSMRSRLHLCWIASLLLVAGCQETGGPGKKTESGSTAAASAIASGDKKYRIAVIPKGTTHQFWSSVHAGAANAAKELGNVEIIWKGPLQENDRTGQINVVQDFINSKVDGMCLAPLDSQSLVEPVQAAVDAGIPVVVFDSGLDEGASIVSYVATDNRNGGAVAAKRLAEILGGKGDVILLRYNPGSESTLQREEGFLDTLKQEYPDINILLSEEYLGVTPEDSLDKATQVLTRFRDQVDGVFTVCEPNATGTLNALEQLELNGKVKFIAFDPNEPLINGLSNNSVHGIVLQDPVKMGYLAVKAMVDHLEGRPVEKRVVTGEYVATPENMSEPQMDQLLKPQQFHE